jgi:hypothetical protein
MSIDAVMGGIERRLPGLPPGASIPVHSRDGSLFAFTAPGGQNFRDLWIGTVDGKRIEAVTEKMGIRSVFWGPESRKIYYEVGGKGYGVGIWEMDLTTMESKALLNNISDTGLFEQGRSDRLSVSTQSGGVRSVHHETRRLGHQDL